MLEIEVVDFIKVIQRDINRTLMAIERDGIKLRSRGSYSPQAIILSIIVIFPAGVHARANCAAPLGKDRADPGRYQQFHLNPTRQTTSGCRYKTKCAYPEVRLNLIMSKRCPAASQATVCRQVCASASQPVDDHSISERLERPVNASGRARENSGRDREWGRPARTSVGR